MRRRALLSTTGAVLAGAAGCLSGSSDDPADGTGTRDRTDTRTDAPPTTRSPDSAVDVSLQSYQPAVLEMATDSVHVSDGGSAYLVLQVDASATADPPARDAFTFELADSSHGPLDPRERRLWRWYAGGEDDGYGAGADGGWLAFELPETVAAERARLTWPGGEWRPNETLRTRLAAERARLTWPGGEWRPNETLRTRLAAEHPPLSMALSVPETVPEDELPTVAVTVENEGDVDARFVAGLNRVGPRIAYTPVATTTRLVPAGGSTTWEHTGEFDTAPLRADELDDGEHDLTYHLNSVLGHESRDVRYVSGDD